MNPIFLRVLLTLLPLSVQAELPQTTLTHPRLIPGIEGGIFQNAFRWVTFNHLEKGMLLFFDPQMTPILKFNNVGKFINFHIEKSLLNVPLLELEFERCYIKNHQTYKAIVGELFEIHGDKLHRIYSYTKQLFYTVKIGGRSKQVILKGMLKAAENHKNTVQFIMQSNQAVPSLKQNYLIDQFTIDETGPTRLFKYQFTFTGEQILDTPPIDINLLGGNSDYHLLNNCKKK